MHRITAAILSFVLGAALCQAAPDAEWKGKWIGKEYTKCATNTWIAFRKEVKVDKVPAKLEARIAADSKYWLWINGETVVFEGGLKRGPAPGDGYYDKVDIAPFLKEGDNLIAVLLWHFGQVGFSHQNSGSAAFLFDAQSPELEIYSDRSWQGTAHLAYGSKEEQTNYRLPESSIRFDARKDMPGWNTDIRRPIKGKALVHPFAPGKAPLGALVERPIPMWKVSGLKEYGEPVRSGDTLKFRMPYNGHYHPYFKVEAPSGKVIRYETDHENVDGVKCVSGEYVTRSGVQEYLSLPWMNGDWMYYIIPEGVKVLKTGYVESSYDAEISGSFSCDDPLLDDYWQKAARTLLVCMRDTYYDCPDRERAQWWGDEVNELGMAFHALDRKADALAFKGARELVNWQRADGVLFAPIPAGNWSKELPMQTLASIGWYGFRTLSWYSGDFSLLPEIYGPVHRYLHEVWKLDADGLPIYRGGDWDWPDAGKNQDKYAQLPPWYYLALKAEAEFARMLGKEADAAEDEAMMARIAESYNRIYWTEDGYRSAENQGPTDDRAQALAVVSGIAGADKYPTILKVFGEQAHATTYMFKYVLEALCKMGHPELAIERMHRFYPTIMRDGVTTLWEHWNFDGSCNHAWSGSGIIILNEEIAGIKPTSPGYRTFSVKPQMGTLKKLETSLDTASGKISLKLEKKGRRIRMHLTVPEGTKAEVPSSKGKTRLLEAGEYDLTI